MCWSNATLFYGLWVTTASLNFAATAHKATRPTILAIDLIINRRRRGWLEIEGQEERTTARELPEEVWELVKDELLGVEVRRAELDTLDDLRCGWCTARDAGEHDCPCDECTLKPEQLENGHLWSCWGPPGCPASTCYFRVRDNGITWQRSSEQTAIISVLLPHHGLALPRAEMWHEDPERYDFDFEALSAIALPLRSTKPGEDAFPSATTDDSHPEGYGITLNAVFELSSEALTLPVNADRRFRRLVSKFRLQVVDRTKSTICPVVEGEEGKMATASEKHAATDMKLKAQKSSAEKDEALSFAEGEPRWVLWSLCEEC